MYSSRESGNWDIYLQRVGGENPINLTADSDADDLQSNFSPDGDTIAFRSERGGGGIFVMGATGESVRRLTDFGFNPVFSPDGAEIAFATESVGTTPSSRGSNSELWVADVQTGDTRLVFEGDAVQPHWSPNGSRISYWMQTGGQRDIWTIPADGGEPIAVTSDAPLDWSPVWSPDGNYVYFSSDRSGSMNLWRVPVDEETGARLGEPEPVTTGASGENVHLSISADGSRMAYAIRRTAGNIMKAGFDPSTNGLLGEPVLVTEGSVTTSGVDVSPNGELLAFYRIRPQEDLFISRPDGTGVRQLTNDRYNDRVPRWSPDGTKIAFYSNRSGAYQLWTINADGSGGLQQLTDDPSEPIFSVWSPDGSRIAYSDFLTGSFIMEVGKQWEDQEPVVLPPLTDGSEFFTAWDWSPDGRWLAGHGSDTTRSPRDNGIYLYSFDSGQYEKVTDTGSSPRWLKDNRTILHHVGPTLFRIRTVDRVSKQIVEVVSASGASLSTSPASMPGPVTSPDDRTLYYLSVEAESDIWLIELPEETP